MQDETYDEFDFNELLDKLESLEATNVDLKEMLEESFKYIGELEQDLLVPVVRRWDLEQLRKDLKI